MNSVETDVFRVAQARGEFIDGEPAPITLDQDEIDAAVKPLAEVSAAENLVGGLLNSGVKVQDLLSRVADAMRERGVTKSERALIVAQICAATGLKPKDVDLPKAVDRKALDAMKRRRKEYEGEAPALIDPKNGAETAKRFLASTQDEALWPAIIRVQGEFFQHAGTCYRPISDELVLKLIYEWLNGKFDVSSGLAIKPDRALAETTLHAVKAIALEVIEAPSWIGDPKNRADPLRIAAFMNGLYDLNARKLMKHTRGFFNLNSRTFRFSPAAGEPKAWLKFLGEVFADETEAIETLQEIAGYLLTADTSQQKMFALIGAPRSGKGTILRVLRELIGADNVTAPTLAGLGGPFGLQGMIGKLAALISDARLGGRADVQAITENLLRVSGEDAISVPRKFLGDLTVRLRVRFVLVSNELPALLDQSGALASRFVLLKMSKSFAGREDPGLTDRLLGELPAIAVWALDGLDRLHDRGHFIQPASARVMVKQLEHLASPVKAFFHERCELVPGASVECSDLFLDWTIWAGQQGREHTGTAQMFGRNVAAAFPELKLSRPRAPDGSRGRRRYEGVRLRVDRDGSAVLPFSDSIESEESEGMK